MKVSTSPSVTSQIEAIGRVWERERMTRFEGVLAALSARANAYPYETEQKNLVQAEFLYGAAAAFALCWRGEESRQCLEAAKALASDILTAEQTPSAGGVR